MTVVEEDEEPVAHAPEMQRLLRQPRCADLPPTCFLMSQNRRIPALSGSAVVSPAAFHASLS